MKNENFDLNSIVASVANFLDATNTFAEPTVVGKFEDSEKPGFYLKSTTVSNTVNNNGDNKKSKREVVFIITCVQEKNSDTITPMIILNSIWTKLEETSTKNSKIFKQNLKINCSCIDDKSYKDCDKNLICQAQMVLVVSE